MAGATQVFDTIHKGSEQGLVGTMSRQHHTAAANLMKLRDSESPQTAGVELSAYQAARDEGDSVPGEDTVDGQAQIIRNDQTVKCSKRAADFFQILLQQAL